MSHVSTVVAVFLASFMVMLSVVGVLMVGGHFLVAKETTDCWVADTSLCTDTIIDQDKVLGFTFQNPAENAVVTPVVDILLHRLPAKLAFCGENCCLDEAGGDDDQAPTKLTCFLNPFKPERLLGVVPHQVVTVNHYLLPAGLTALGLVALLLLGVLFYGVVNSMVQKSRQRSDNYQQLHQVQSTRPRTMPVVHDFRRKERRTRGHRTRY